MKLFLDNYKLNECECLPDGYVYARGWRGTGKHFRTWGMWTIPILLPGRHRDYRRSGWDIGWFFLRICWRRQGVLPRAWWTWWLPIKTKFISEYVQYDEPFGDE